MSKNPTYFHPNSFSEMDEPFLLKLSQNNYSQTETQHGKNSAQTDFEKNCKLSLIMKYVRFN